MTHSIGSPIARCSTTKAVVAVTLIVVPHPNAGFRVVTTALRPRHKVMVLQVFGGTTDDTERQPHDNLSSLR